MSNLNAAVEVVLELPTWKEPFNRESFFKLLGAYNSYRVAGGRHSLLDCLPIAAQAIFLTQRQTIMDLVATWDGDQVGRSVTSAEPSLETIGARRRMESAAKRGEDRSVQDLTEDRRQPETMSNSAVVNQIQGKLRFTSWQDLRRNVKSIQCSSYNIDSVSAYVSKWEMIMFYVPQDTPDTHEDLHKLFVEGIRTSGLRNDVLHRKEEYKNRSISTLMMILLQESEKAAETVSRATSYLELSNDSNKKARAQDNRADMKQEPKDEKPRDEKPRTPVCSHCGKPGHSEDTCWSKNPSLRPERKNGKKPGPRGSDARVARELSDSLLIQPGTIQGSPVNILLDSGASNNFVDKRFFQEYPEYFGDTTRDPKTFRTMGGRVEVTHHTSVRIKMGKHEMEIRAYVWDLDSEDFQIIMGLSDIKKYDLLPCMIEDLSPHIMGANAYTGREEQIEHQDEIHLGEMLTIPKDPDLRAQVEKAIASTQPELQEKLHTVLMSHAELFQSNLPEEGARMNPLNIELEANAELPRSKPRFFTPKITGLIAAEVRRLEDAKIIRRSQSPVASPVVARLKPDGSLRLCIDYVRLNRATIPTQAPIPSIPYILHMMQGQTLFATMDLRQGYYQALVEESSRYLTAFTCGEGLFEFNRVPFGLRNAPGYFQAEMSKILGNLIGRCCFVFIDDIIIFAKTEDDFMQACGEILERLRNYNIRIKLDKCCFGASKVDFLGFIVDSSGIRMDDTRKQGVKDMVTPVSKKQVRSFLGVIGFHRSFIPNFHRLTAPLQRLLRKQAEFVWGPEQDESFQAAKEAVLATGMLYHLDYNHPILIRTDASLSGIGAELFQEVDGLHRTVAYLSHAFTDQESRWATIEQEAFAIYYAVMKWGHLLQGHAFTVESDHKNLEYLFKSDVPKLVRWRLRLQEFNFEIKHIRGTDNVVADGLSRCFTTIDDGGLQVYVDPADKERLISNIHNSIMGHHGRDRTVEMLKGAGLVWVDMVSDVDLYIRKCPLCQKIREGKSSMDAALHSSFVDVPGAVWVCDALGPLPPDMDGNKHIMVCMDAFTRYVELIPCKQVTAKAFAEAFLAVVGRHGFPKSIRSDNGPQFAAKMTDQLLQLLQVDHQFTLPYRPQSNGLVERVNREVMRHLRTLMAVVKTSEMWTTYLPLVQRIINTSHHRAIGTSPARLVYGDGWNINKGIMDTRNTLSRTTTYEGYIQEVNENIQGLLEAATQMQDIHKRQWLDKSPTSPVTFQVGTYVLWEYPKRAPTKLLSRWRGPYIIVEQLSEGNRYNIQHLETMEITTAHITNLKPFEPGSLDDAGLRNLAALDLDEAVIESIIDHTYVGRPNARRKHLKDFDFLVRWAGFGPEEDLWMPYDGIKDTIALGCYLETHPELPVGGEV